jgi:hypothetical protein
MTDSGNRRYLALMTLAGAMNSILYGNFQVVVSAGRGSRVDRVRRQDPVSHLVPRPGRAPQTAPAFPAGRDEQLDAVRRAVRAQRPVGFFGSCGYGKTTLLRYVAAAVAAEGLPRAGVYLQAGPGGLDDVLHRLVGELFTADRPVKLTPDECARVLGQAQALVALDDVALSRDQADYLQSVLSGCDLLISSRLPVLRQDDSHQLAGLPFEAALQLVTGDLGRPLSSREMPLVQRLIRAVDGQPLHLRQVTALVSAGRPLQELAEAAERDPEALDRLSVGALPERYRRALAILALAAGALLPSDVVAAMGDIAEVGECLGLLHRRGLAEQQHDRFGLPVCKAEGYRQMLLADVHHAAALRELVSWLAASNPAAPDSISAASAALAIAGWAAEDGDWPWVVQLIRVAEPILTLAGRWEASRQALSYGLTAATRAGDHLSEALFAHEQGTLALCLDQLTSADELLSRALRLREDHGDRDGAAVTRHNLAILRTPGGPGRGERRRHRARKAAVMAGGGVLALLALTTGVVRVLSPGPAPALTPSSTAPATPSPAASRASEGPTQPASPAPGNGSTGTAGSGTSSSPATTGSSPLPPQVSPVSFGLVDITPGDPAPVQDVSVYNPNTQPLTVTGAQISSAAPFSIAGDKCLAQPIPPQGACAITVQFAPGALGKDTATIIVDSAAKPATGQLSGTGYVKLTVSLSGTGSVAGAGISCSSSCTGELTSPGITLTATPAPGLDVAWGDGCQSAAGGATCTLSVSADTTVSADFYTPIQ